MYNAVEEDGNTMLGTALNRLLIPIMMNSEDLMSIKQITIKPKHQLLSTIIKLFGQAVRLNNDIIAGYIIERWRHAIDEVKTDGMDEIDMIHLVRITLFEQVILSHALKPYDSLSQSMIRVLLKLPYDMLPKHWLTSMNSSTSHSHAEVDLYLEVTSYIYRRPATVIEEYITSYYCQVFHQCQTLVINQFQTYLSEPQSNLSKDIAEEMLNSSSRLRHNDLYLLVVQHLDWSYGAVGAGREEQVICTGLRTTPRPLTVDSIKLIQSRKPRGTLFTELIVNGNHVFLEAIKHLLPALIQDIGVFLDSNLLSNALVEGHYECALFILDNIMTHPLINYNWPVHSIDMSNDQHNWCLLIDRLLNTDRVVLIWDSVYSSVIRYKRMDVIKRIEQAIRVAHFTNLTGPLNIAMSIQYIEGIKSVLQSGRHIQTNYHYRYFKLQLLDQLPEDVVEMILSTASPGCLYNWQNTPSCWISLKPSTIRLMIKYGHEGCNNDVLSYNAAVNGLLDEFKELNKTGNAFINMGALCRRGSDVASMLVHHLENSGPYFDITPLLLRSLINFGQGNKVDALLASPQHLERVDSTDGWSPALPGMLMRSDVISFFSLRVRARSHIPIGANNNRLYHDVSALSREMIEFIWSRVEIRLKQDTTFINEVLTSRAGVNNVILYRVVLDSLIDDNHFQTPFIHAPRTDCGSFKHNDNESSLLCMFTL
ncbi:hypothetical protein SAMD00019534_080570 [Acytostelium subglobosum LB1]|uniref:hypothetical protein n=1 Tax=Acytostelium subglobosum LB1 TaxID=1410327 RepID=UPI000644F0C9|nr:hypothetical protein SAMD00019534_080570 [Acytostelium subglobosum LB1]GAM24882.1 hypothetical protein SAMD00019534_080570 [Acytostelium subglobosum LB1]|eukprot:XP_012751971.1 hypothetical protein SAMD00019534_080570 [Acytostelium subglobosum LB1]